MMIRICVVLCLVLASLSSNADNYPSKQITIVVPYSAGGSADLQARPLAQAVAERLGKPVIVDNRPGAGGTLAMDYVSRAVADGHTLLLSNYSMLVSEPILRGDAKFEVPRDFSPIAILTEQPFILVVSRSLGASSVGDIIALAKKSPGKLSYASWGMGSSGHLVGELFNASAAIDILHVPYKGQAPAINDVLGGHITMMHSTPLPVSQHIKSGKLVAIAVTGKSRLSFLPKVPAFQEAGLSDLDLRIWTCLVAPAKTPPAILSRLQKVVADVLKSSEYSRKVEAEGATVVASDSAEVPTRIKTDSVALRKLLERVKIEIE